MRRLLLLVLLASTLSGPARAVSPALEAAQKALEVGAYEDVLAALEGAALEGADRKAAADVYANAAEWSLRKADGAVALLLAQKALKLDAQHGHGLEMAATSCRLEKEYGAAERYADTWIKADPKAPGARLLRAEIALDQGEWQKALDFVRPVALDTLPASQRERHERVASTAKGELDLYAKGMSVLKALEEQRPGTGSGETTVTKAPAKGVVVYTTSWCGYCRKLKGWLKEQGIPYVEKDVEKDRAAAGELAAKARRTGVSARGVPVTDVKGTLVMGYDPEQIESLLK